MTDSEDLLTDHEADAARSLSQISASYAALEKESRSVRDQRLAERLSSLLRAGARTPFLTAIAHAIGFSSLGEEEAADAIVARGISEVFAAVLDGSPQFEHLVELSRIEPVRSDGRLEFVLVLPEEMEAGPRLAEYLLAIRKLWGGALTVYSGGAVIVVHDGDSEEDVRAQWEIQTLDGETRS